MTLTEAIQQNQALWRELDIPERAKERESIGLGIEALKREQVLRREVPYTRDGLLPGETQE